MVIKMPSTKIIFIFFLLLTSFKLGVADVDPLLDSYNWPSKVTVNEQIEEENEDGQNKTLRAGTSGILQRVEDGLLLIDFGHHGLFWLRPDQTDFSVQYDRLKSNKDHKDFPNAMVQIGNKIIHFPKRTARHVLIEDIKEYEFFLCYYANVIDEENVLITQALNNAFKDRLFAEHGIWPVAFPGKDRWYGYFQKAFNELPVFIPHMRLSYAAAFRHEPNPTPSFVLIDANGKVIYRSETLKLVKPKFSKRIIGSTSYKRRSLSLVFDELEKAVNAIQEEEKVYGDLNP